MWTLQLKSIILSCLVVLPSICHANDNSQADIIDKISSQKDYSDEQVYRIYSDNTTELLRDIILPIVKESQYDIWLRNSKYVDIQLHKEDMVKIVDFQQGILDYEVFVEDINEKIEQTMPSENENENNNDILGNLRLNDNDQIGFSTDDHISEILGDIFFNEYRNLNTIEIWLKLLQETFPDFVKLEEIGTTPQGHSLNVVHISAHNYIDNPDKKTIIITGGLHAREWISISTACYTMYELLLNYGKDKKATKYLDSLDFIFVPVFNPDGYDYSWTTDRLWRKNRQATSIESCPGLDIDRSFGFQWAKSHEFPCSESYNGEVPFEAQEAQYWDIYLREIKKDYKIFGYLDLHSYSEEILYPYGYSCDALPRDIENLLELAFGLAKAIRLTTKKNYDVIAACKDSGSDLTPGIGGGTALDYMYHNRARWALQLKLRDSGNHGFLLPSKYIKPVGRETYASLMYFCGFILNPEI
ncbi:similar to Saccharomyces cerevisiae YHR132C ECM14 Putative metalloprotease with similarity to the zinc carboxypeptidase family, required for normal cell wall assembly [Maudiozyma barnettii]|uniref:Inactive metallocarboxypeptidase ECM14 n=1 Tax=Maudiozyma barnettii TaxID=61262 RepID=A0A8H2VHQ6_9SACH|nr:putative metallocarboxypeptidase [Kazachstania barnettii]CAB4255651.1 similar to Saccharomyces cerevisiae YHR132C ECM14 Putative metalloprotease with similarity to the zinc carboxypeptidase family, required for normal cell wall assembly [Kazachstania barnettii]CAD1784212.1 similar to Saccharomyces cerevisiae YHR132C ECM14 Putative metalloprotease with similarity to the zinc carboxypeptidase family, required for normal cell wall assembly [Kazachstania barnettii]